LYKLSSKDFSRLRDSKTKTFKTKNLLFFYQTENTKEGDLKIGYGFTVTKKKIRDAVGRNRVKRLLRESLRSSLNFNNVASSLKVNIVYAPKSDLSSSLCFKDVRCEVEQFFSKFS
jgi:ribonuclease P protein component